MCCATLQEEVSDQYVQLVENEVSNQYVQLIENIDGELVVNIDGNIIIMSDVVQFWEIFLQDNDHENTDGNESEKVNEEGNEEDIFDMETVILDDDLSYQNL